MKPNSKEVRIAVSVGTFQATFRLCRTQVRYHGDKGNWTASSERDMSI
jgi:hypothetical protein